MPIYDFEVAVAYVTDPDVTYGEFTITANDEAVTYWYPISNFADATNDQTVYKAKAYTLEWLDEDNNTEYYTGTYHDVTDVKSESYGSEVVTGDSKANPAVAGTKLNFDKNDELKLVSCVKVGKILAVKYDDETLQYNMETKAYDLFIENPADFAENKLEASAEHQSKAVVSKDGRVVTVTFTSVDGFCTKDITINLISTNTALDKVTVDGTSVDVLASGETAAAATVKHIDSKAKFTLKAIAADDAAKVAIGSGETLNLAVANLNADSVKTNEVTVTESTAVNGGFVVVKVTAESGAVAYYVYSTAAAPATGN